VATYPPPPQTGPPPYAGSGPSGPRAGFWARFAALFIDGLIVAIIPAIFLIVGAARDSDGLLAVGYLLYLALYAAYEIYFNGGRTGQTIGKRALGIRVVDFNTGGPIGYGRGTLRLIGRWISGAVCYLGYLWMLWDKEKQCWHDKMANDVVVPVSYYPVGGSGGTTAVP
jgi:uncharacterized RDD family membrane protein YckC